MRSPRKILKASVRWRASPLRELTLGVSHKIERFLKRNIHFKSPQDPLQISDLNQNTNVHSNTITTKHDTNNSQSYNNIIINNSSNQQQHDL